MSKDYFANAQDVLKKMPDLKYPTLYCADFLNYFNNMDSVLNCTDDLYVLTQKLNEMKEVVQEITSDNMVKLNYIVRGLHEKMNQAEVNSWYKLDPATLTANELLYVLCYPFWSRMAGSWEVRFAINGELGKYLSLYKEKVE